MGWWLRGFCQASSTVLVQRARHRHVALCVVCVLGLSQLVVLAAARRPPRPTQFGDFTRKDALDHSCHPPPPCMPNPGIDPTTFRLRNLRSARLS